MKKTKPPERLGWLLRFLRTDLGASRPGAGPGARLALAADAVFHLASPAAIVPTRPPDGYGLALAKLAGTPVPEPVPTALTDEQLRALQATLLFGVAHWQAGLRWMPLHDGRLPVVLEPLEDGTIGRRYLASRTTALLLSAIDLLVEWWPRILRCEREECGALFLPRERRQVFHDTPCGNLYRYHQKRVRDEAQKTRERENARLRAARKKKPIEKQEERVAAWTKEECELQKKTRADRKKKRDAKKRGVTK